jgi:pSer/pThr/pTyr-binding forkhead associated (FHA) protein
MASLWVTSGSRAGQSVGISDELIIGRENADLSIDDAEVSRRHAAVRLEGGQLEVEDLGSSNGTFVDGSRIEGAVRVGGGAKIRVGQTEFEVRGVAPTTGQKQDLTEAPASPIADPDVTRARPIPDPEVTKARSVPEPQVTKAAPISDPETTRARAIPDVQATKAHAVPEPEVTRARSVPADLAKPQASSESVRETSPPRAPAPAAPAPGSSKNVAAEVSPFSPPDRRRSRGLASRSWVPTVASFVTAIVALVALIVYFAVHGVPS